MLLKKYVGIIKKAEIESKELKEFVEVIKSANINQILNFAKIIVEEKKYKKVNERIFNVAKTITVLHYVDQTEKLYPYSEKDLDKLGYSIYKKFYKWKNNLMKKIGPNGLISVVYSKR